MDHSSGSLSDEGKVFDCGPTGDTILINQGLSNLDRNFTPLIFSVTDVKAGCDLLNVFTEERLDIMKSDLNLPDCNKGRIGREKVEWSSW